VTSLHLIRKAIRVGVYNNEMNESGLKRSSLSCVMLRQEDMGSCLDIVNDTRDGVLSSWQQDEIIAS